MGGGGQHQAGLWLVEQARLHSGGTAPDLHRLPVTWWAEVVNVNRTAISPCARTRNAAGARRGLRGLLHTVRMSPFLRRERAAAQCAPSSSRAASSSRPARVPAPPRRRFGLATWIALPLLAACADTTPADAPATAERVVLATAPAVDLAFDLLGPEAATERIIGLPSAFDEYINVTLPAELLDPDRRFPEFNAELLLALDPDLIIAGSWIPAESVEHLTSAGVDVYVMPTVTDLDHIRQAIHEVGARLGVEARAAELLADFDARVAALEARKRARDQLVTGYSYTNYGSGGWTAGSGTTADLILELAGVRNLAAAAGREGHDMVDFETLFAWDADCIVVSSPSNDYGQTRAYLEHEEVLAELRAIREGHVVEVPAALFSTTSHYLVAAAEDLAERVYPAPSSEE